MYSSLRIKTAPTSEPVSLVDAKRHLRVDNSDDDAEITALITVARRWVEGVSGRALVNQELLYSFTQDPPSGSLPLLPMPLLVMPMIMSAPQIMARPIELPRSPVTAVSSVVITDLDGNATALVSGTDYFIDLTVDPGRVRMQWMTVPRFLQHVQIDFTAGYGADATAVNLAVPGLVHAIKVMLAWLYEHRGDDDAADPPKIVDWLIAPDRVVYFGG